MRCIYCNETVIKKGKRKGIQKYQCKICNRYQQAVYTKQHIPKENYKWVHRLNNDGNGISSISRLLHIAKSSRKTVCFTRSEKMLGNCIFLLVHKQ
jgi:transposase-like protein